jgi:hypothetical protein
MSWPFDIEVVFRKIFVEMERKTKAGLEPNEGTWEDYQSPQHVSTSASKICLERGI